MHMYAKEDIHSHIVPSRVYALQGEMVRVISHNETVALVEGSRGKFPCRYDRLSATYVAPKAEMQVATNPSTIKKRRR